VLRCPVKDCVLQWGCRWCSKLEIHKKGGAYCEDHI
jgi:hypothetical protein